MKNFFAILLITTVIIAVSSPKLFAPNRRAHDHIGNFTIDTQIPSTESATDLNKDLNTGGKQPSNSIQVIKPK